MERHEIETFLVLAEELHFARTAERVRVSPGRVSQTIKKIERRIGGALFERTSRRVELTALGRSFRDDLQPAYQRVQQAIGNATAAAHRVAEVLEVAFSTPWCGTLLVRAADAFEVECPGCEVRIREVSLADPYGPIQAGEIDLQLSEFPISEPGLTPGPVLFTEPAALAVPADHALAQQDSASLEDLAQAPLITFATPAQPLHDIHYPRSTPSGKPVEHLPVRVDFPEALCLIGEGRGITPVAARARDYHARPDVAFLPLTDAPPFEYGLLWRTGERGPAVRTFARIVRDLA
ncbi:LysR family transcriptional regulator [Nocardia lasii]|uniref:LysR family transcriptional regulator n=1 Tax=Nocardia lasii TaxID=1616107 RepID=A0ABW1JY75_9NOCA